MQNNPNIFFENNKALLLSIFKKRNILLEKDTYSRVFSATENASKNLPTYAFRFYRSTENEIYILSSSNKEYHAPYIKGRGYFIYDEELKRTLEFALSNILNQIKKIRVDCYQLSDLNLSYEQKNTLLLGQDLTLSINGTVYTFSLSFKNFYGQFKGIGIKYSTKNKNRQMSR